MIRVVIADDQALVRGGIRMILETQADIEIAGEAADGDEAVAMTRQLAPDVVLMDIRMPGTDGVQATRAITRDRAPGDRPRVLVVTTFDLDHYVYQALKAGASGFLLKDEPPETLAAAVRTVAAGDALLAPVLLRRLLDEYVSRPEPGQVSPPPELTEREVVVLQLIGRGRSSCSRTRLASSRRTDSYRDAQNQQISSRQRALRPSAVSGHSWHYMYIGSFRCAATTA
jgi:DNA-binding NarL/FixJ family response regulator